MYAIVKVGGKQYRVEKGDSLLVDRMPDDEGAKVRLEPLLLAPDGASREPVFGKEALAKGKVEATVTGHERGPKIHVLKFKPKQGYKRRQGHRSELTRLEIGDIELLGAKSKAKAAGRKPKPAAAKPAEPKGKGKPAEPKSEDTGPDPKKNQGDKLEEAVGAEAPPATEKPASQESAPEESPAPEKERGSDGS
jgi:large subunit ribosomal protein L21